MDISKTFSRGAAFCFLMAIFGALESYAQEFSAGINVDSPNPNAVLHLASPNGNQGLLIPNLTSAQRTAMALTTGDNGLLVFDGDQGLFYYWLAPNWIPLLITETTQTLDLTGTDLTISGGNVVDLSTLGFLTTEGDPTVPAGIKDGIDWTELTGIPADIADGDDGGGIATVGVDGTTITGDGVGTPLSVGTLPAGQVSGLSTVATTGNFADLATIPAGLADGDDTGILTVNVDGATVNGNGVGTPLSVGTITVGQVSGLSTVATTGNFADLATIPAGLADGDDTGILTVNVDGATVNGDGVGTPLSVGTITVGQVSGLSTVATTGNFADLNTIPAGLADGDDTGILTVNVDGATVNGNGVGTPLSVGTITVGQVSGLSTVATTGNFADLATIPAGLADGDDTGILTVNVDGATVNGNGVGTPLSVGTITVGQVSGLSTVATTGNFADLATIPAGLADGDDTGILTVNVDGATVNGDGVGTPLSVGTITVGQVSGLSTVATTGNFADLNTIPAGLVDGDDTGILTVNVDGATVNGDGVGTPLSVGTITVGQVSGLATVATTGSYADLTGAIDNTTVGATTPATGDFTTLGAGTLVITGPTSLDGSVGLGDTNADLITVSGKITGNNALIFDGATDNANTTTFVITEPTAVNTITFPNTSGTVVLNSSITLQNAYSGGGSTIVTNGTDGAFAVSGDQPLSLSSTGNNVDISTFTTGIVNVDGVNGVNINASAGALNIGSDADAQPINIGTGASARNIAIGNNTGATGVTIDGGTNGIDLTGDTNVNGGTLTVASASSFTGDVLGGQPLVFQGATNNANTTTLAIQDPSGNNTIFFPDQSGTVLLSASITLQSAYDGGNTIVTSGGNPFDVSGAEAINLSANSNNINLTTNTAGTVSINGADQVDVTAGAGGINLQSATNLGGNLTVADIATTNLNSNITNIGNATADVVDITATTNINGGTITIASPTSITGNVQGASPLVFEGGTVDANTTTLAIEDPTGVNTIFFPNQSGTVLLGSSITLQSAYDGGNTIVTSGGNPFDVSGSEAVSLAATANNINLTTNTSGSVNLTSAQGIDLVTGAEGTNLSGGTVTIADGSPTRINSDDLQIGNAATDVVDITGTTDINGGTLSVDDASPIRFDSDDLQIGNAATDVVDITGTSNINGGTLTIASATSITGDVLGANPLVFEGATNDANATTFSIVDPTGANTIFFPDQSGTVVLGSSFTLQSAYDGGNTIVTSGGNPFDVSGSEAVSLAATANSINLTTNTSGSVNLTSAQGIDLVTGAEGTNLSGGTVTIADGSPTRINSDDLQIGNAASDVIDITGTTDINGGTLSVDDASPIRFDSDDLQIGNAATDVVDITGTSNINGGTLTIASPTSITGDVLGANPLVFEGATNDANATTFSIVDPTGANTIFFPDQSGTVVLGSSFTLQSAYDGGNTIVTSGGNPFDLSGSEAVSLATTANNINLSTNTSGSVNLTSAQGIDLVTGAEGTNLSGGTVTIADGSPTRINSDDLQIGNAASDVVDITGTSNINGGTLTIASATSITGNLLGANPLVFEGATNDANATTFSIVDPTGANTIFFPDQSGTVVLGSSFTLQSAYDGGNTIVTSGSNPFDVSGSEAVSLATTANNINLTTNTSGSVNLTSAQGIDLVTGAEGTNLSGGTVTIADGSPTRINSDDLQIGNAASDVIDITGTSNINGGTLTIASATSITGNLLGANPLVFEGATNDANATTFSIADPTAANTIVVPNQSGTVLLDGALTLQNSYTGGNTITTSAADGTFQVNGDQNISLATTSGSSAAISLNVNGGSTETLEITSSQGLGNNAVDINALSGGIDLDAITGVEIDASNGPISIDGTSSSNFTVTGNDGANQVLTISATNAGAGDGDIAITADGDIAITPGGTVTITNLSLISPDISTSIDDINNNELFTLNPTASAVNELSITNAATGAGPVLGTSGDDANVDMNIVTQGAGNIIIDAGTGGMTIDANNGVAIDAAAGPINIGVDATAQPINVGTGAAARPISIGNNTGTTAVNIDAGTGGIDLTGNANLNGGTTTIDSDLIVNGDVLGATPLVFQGATSDANTTTLSIGDPTSTNTIFLPENSGTIVLDGDIDLQGSYDGGNSIVTSGGRELNISGSEDVILSSTANDINLSTSTSGSVSITSAQGIQLTSGTEGTNLSGGTITIADATPTRFNSDDLQIGNAATDVIDITGTTNINGAILTIGTSVSITGEILGTNAMIFEGATVDANETTIAIENPTAANTIILPNQSGTVVLDGQVTLQNAYVGGNTITTDATNGAFQVSGDQQVFLSADNNTVDISTTTAGTVSIDGVSGVNINAAGGAINIGTNADAQPVSIGTGAASRTVTIGNNTGTTGIDITSGTNGIDLTGNTNINGGTLTIDSDLQVNGEVQGANPLVFQGATLDAITTTFNVTDPTATSKTITFPDQTGTVVLDGDLNLQNAYVGGNTITTDATNGAFQVSGDQQVFLSADNNTVDISTTTAGTVSIDGVSGVNINAAGGAINIGTNADAQPVSIGTGAASRTVTIGNNTGATGIDITSGTNGIDLTGNTNINGGTLTIDSDLQVNGEVQGANPLVFQGATLDAITTTFNVTDPTATSKTITFPDQTGTVVLDGDLNLQNAYVGGNTITTDATNGAFQVSGDQQVFLSADNNTVDISTTTAGTVSIDGVSGVNINAAGGAINIGTNADAQPVSIGTGAASRTVTIGNNTGTTGIDITSGTNGIDLTGNTNINGGTLTIDSDLQVNGEVQGANPLVFQGATLDAITTTFSVTDPTTTSKTITFPDQTGTVVLDGDLNLQNAYVGGNTITTDATNGAFQVSGDQQVFLSADNNTVDISTTTAGTVSIDGVSGVNINAAGGAINIGTNADAQPVSIGTGAASRTVTIGNNTGATGIDITSGTNGIDLTGNTNINGGTLTIDSDLQVNGEVQGANPLVFQGATSDAITTTFNITDPTTTSKTITFPDQTGTVVLDGDLNLQNAYVGGNTITTDATNGAFQVSGDQQVFLSADNNTVDISTTTAGTVSIDGVSGVNINAAGGAINIGTNADAQPVSIGTGAASRTVTIGNNTGTTGIDITSGTNGIDLTGNTNINGGTLTIDSDLQVNGEVQGANPLVFQGATLDAITTTFSVTDPTTTSKTITFPDQTGTVVLDGDLTLQNAYDGGNSIVTSGGNALQVSGTEAISLLANSNDISLTTNTSGTISLIGSSQVNISGGAGGINLQTTTSFSGGAVNAADATTFNINSSTINLGNANTDQATIAADLNIIGDILGATPLVFQGGTDDLNTTAITPVNPTTVNVISLPDNSGTVLLDGDLSLQNAYNGGAGIVTSGGNTLQVSGSEAISLTTTSNDISLITNTSGTISLISSSQINLSGGAGGINLQTSTSFTGPNFSTADASVVDLNSGTINIGNANTDQAIVSADLTVSGDVLGANPLVFQGGSDDANTTTFTVVDPTTVNVISIPDNSGTLVLEGDINLQRAYDGGGSITTSGTIGAFQITGDQAIDLATTLDAPDAIALTTNGGANETINITNTLGSGTVSIEMTSVLGGLSLNAGNSSNLHVVTNDGADTQLDILSTNVGGGAANILLDADTDIVLAAEAVGIQTPTPVNPFQIGDSFGFFHFRNDTEGREGEIIVNNLALDASSVTDNEFIRLDNGPSAFMLLEDNQFNFLQVAPGTNGDPVDISNGSAEVFSWLTLDAAGDLDFGGAARFGDVQGTPENGMIRYDGTNLQGREGNAWINLTGGFALPFSDFTSADGGTLFQIENAGTGPAAFFGSSTDGTAMELRGGIDFFSGADRAITVFDNTVANGNVLRLRAGNSTFMDGTGGNIDISAGSGDGTGNGGDVVLNPGGSTGSGSQGQIFANGDIIITGNGTTSRSLRFNDADQSRFLAFRAPNNVTAASSVTWTLPDGDGAANQVLQTDGNGVLSFVNNGALTIPFNAGGTEASIPLFEITNTLQARAGLFANANNILSPGLTVGNNFTGTGNTGGVFSFGAVDDGSDFRDIVLLASNVTDDAAATFSGGLIFHTRNNGAIAERMRLTDNGRLGVNNNNPQGSLDVEVGVGSAYIRGNSNIAFGLLQVINAGVGDASVRYEVAGGQLVTAGLDATDNSYKINMGSLIVDQSDFRIASSGDITAGHSLGVNQNLSVTERLVTPTDPSIHTTSVDGDVLEPDHRVIRINDDAATNINAINPATSLDGQELILVSVNNVVQIIDQGGGSNIVLDGGADFPMTPNSTLHLIYIESQNRWLEISRSQAP